MMTDDGLAELFERATADLDPGVPAIVGRAERLGRRMRTRLRMWMALGSCLALATLGAAGLGAGVVLAHPQGARIAAGVTSGRPSGRGDQASPAASASPTPSASAGSTPGIDGGSSGQLAPGYPMSTGQMLGVLRKLLPAGSTVSNVNRYSSGDGSLEVDYNDGQGAVDLQIEVAPTATFAPLNCPKPLWTDEGPRPAGALPISCAMRTLPDGSVERDAVYYADAYGFYGYSVYDQRPDGVTVDIQVGNGILHTLPQVDRARPPGSMAEWEAVAENPAWR